MTGAGGRKQVVMERSIVSRREWRWVLTVGLVALALTCGPYLLGWSLETPERVFGGFNLLLDDCYSYLAKMRQGAEGAWLFHIAYTSEPHPGTFFFPFHLLLGKVAALLPGLENNLTAQMVWVYHGARVIFGLLLLLTVYRFLAVFTARVKVRRLAWLMVTCGGGLGWLLVISGQPNWLGTPPLDFYLPEGFALLVLYGFPHVAAAQSLLLGGFLYLLKAWQEHPNPKSRITGLKWATLAGFLWLVMGLIVPFYVAVAWAVMGVAWVVLTLRERRVCWREWWLAGAPVFISAPVVAYSAWVFTTDPVYETWSAQNLILSPHPLHYLAAYGPPLALAAFAVGDAWRDEGPAWLPLAWVGVAPVLVYLPFNLQRRLVAGVQVPLSLLAAWGAVRLWRSGGNLAQHRLFRPAQFIKRWLVVALLVAMVPTSLITLAGSSFSMFSRPPLVFRDAAEIAALDWLAGQVQPDDVILTAYDTGNYLPVRVVARVFLGHGLETVDADEKEALVASFFGATADDTGRQQLLSQYGVDYVFWGPVERRLGTFDPHTAPYLQPVYEAREYTIFEVKR